MPAPREWTAPPSVGAGGPAPREWTAPPPLGPGVPAPRNGREAGPHHEFPSAGRPPFAGPADETMPGVAPLPLPPAGLRPNFTATPPVAAPPPAKPGAPSGGGPGVQLLDYLRRRKKLAAIGLAALLLMATGVAAASWLTSAPPAPQATTAARPSHAAVATLPALPDAGPSSGAGTFVYATGTGQPHGTAGALKKYKVAVENGSGQDAAAFAAVVDQVLADPRGWTGGGSLKLQRVPSSATADVTVFLATPVTSESMCAAGGLHTAQFTSCYLPGKVIINLARWLTGVTGYPSVDAYRQFAVNHELGRFLGNAVEGCPKTGKPAPVMMQQTLGLKGCTANPSPYIDGQIYSGPKVP